MKKLFALKNISLQPMVVQDGLDITIAYTKQLLAKDVLIEFYTAPTSDDPHDTEEETAVLAITYTKDRSYSFALFHSFEVIGPLILYRIVSDAIEFIENCDKDSLITDLEEIATGYTTSDILDDPKDRKRIYDSEVWKFKTALELIGEKRHI